MKKKLFGKTSSQNEKPKTIILVSGLPRSGTSMMMKMLAEGGLSIVTDSLREPDEDNPGGYFEYEPVKNLVAGQTQWLAEANQRVVKIISALLEFLPSNYHYKILFMERDIQEILRSQKKMLTARMEKSKVSDEQMEAEFTKHLSAVKFWLARQPNVDVLYVDYNKLISDPDGACQAIADFLEVPIDVEKMQSVPNERLYRNRNIHS